MKKALSTILVLLGASGTALAETTVAIEGATVHTEPGVTLKNATILIKDGVISEVGTAVRVPAKAQRIDARGKVVTAGFVESSTRLGLVEVSLESSTREGAFGGEDRAIHAAYRVIDGYNPASVAIPVARSGGVTAAVTTPTGGLIAGQSAWISTAAGRKL